MNTKALLRLLCLLACGWTGWMIVGVVGLARHQNMSSPLGVMFELSMFAGAGFLPLLLISRPAVDPKAKVLLAIWSVCIVYVTLLALNTIRLGNVTRGGLRLTLWVGIALLLVKFLRTRSRHLRESA